MRTRLAAKGSVTPFGYRRITCKDRRRRFEHVLVWESRHGPVPAGMEVHHINGNKLDNRIENLMLLSRLDHKRVHSGCYRVNGVWWKQCRRCRWYRSVDAEFYTYPGSNGVMGLCKRCAIDVAVENKRRRAMRRKADPAKKMATLMPEKTPAEMAGVSDGEGK